MEKIERWQLPSVFQSQPPKIARLPSGHLPRFMALKQITGKLEMGNYCIDGRVPFERDILMWLVGELYMEGPEKWGDRLTKASDKFKNLVSTN